MAKTDILIAGTGLVGAAMASALADSDAEITIIDAKPYKQIESQSSRPISLTYASHLILKRLGLWDALAPSATPILQVHVSDKGHFGMSRIKASDCDVPALGYVVDLVKLYNGLHSKLYQQKNLNILSPCEITAMRELDDKVEIDCAEGTIETPLLIAADGQQSFIRNQMHIGFEENPDKAAVVAQLSAEHHNTAYERFTPEGTIAMLPMQHNRCGLVWTLDHSDALMELSDEEFLKRLQKTFGYRLGALKDLSPRHSITLKTGFAKQQVKGHTVLLGNAAHTLHPVAAQGFNLSLNDVASLYDVIKEGKPLQDYIDWRSKHQHAVFTYTNSLMWIFKQQTLSLPRSFGLALFDTCPTLKSKFAQFAMGMMGEQPTLANV